ncbi:GntR family transcriptional regulator [Pseudonocardia petroleophila]|uniref:GntR family transcriptional regulator n=1 Tax=Pseudonocardia petroleophila TaxID=37331 RepID=A0A7G7MME5_9PSEU|nr:GntR family transcriptional regulator [Pseudonocardia petroleophila]QNG53956.1 GntR family transcriptional regulator [Pseudonocardia petroleophila]
MQPLDPDDPRPPFQQVANVLRAAIKTRRFEPGEQLPSLNELSKTYGVSLMTVQKAIAVLRDEGLIISRQGKGSFVRQRTERAVGLRPHIELAFEQQRVTIDFAGFTGETLSGAIQEPLDKIRSGRLTPEEIALRVLLPDMTAPVGLPALASTGEDDERVRGRMDQIMRRFNQALADSLQELSDLQLVRSATVEVRTYRTSPLFKLYIINGDEVFYGFYPVLEHKVVIDKEPTAILDPMGKDATLFHFAATEDDSSVGAQYVAEAQKWFNSVWDSVARPVGS